MIKLALTLIAALTFVACSNESGPKSKSVSAKSSTEKLTKNKQVALKADKRYPESKANMVLKQVSKHVYYIQGRAGAATEHEGFISNAGVIITPKGIVIIDALGSPSLARLMLKKIREISDKPIIKVISTHYHADHIYGLQVFKDMGVKIIAPAGTWTYLAAQNSKDLLISRRMTLEPWVNKHTRLVKPDQVIQKMTVLDFGGVRLKLNYIGSAHSDGDLTVYVENDRVLLSGDLIFEGRVPYIGTDDTGHWLKTLKSMRTSKLVALVPGHGKALKNPGEVIKLNYDYLHLLRTKMKEGVDDFMSFEEAYKRVDWSEFSHLAAFKQANRPNSYRVYRSLESESLK